MRNSEDTSGCRKTEIQNPGPLSPKQQLYSESYMAQILMMVAAAEGSTNLDLSVRETKSKVLMLLEQKIYQIRATQENIDQLVINSPSVGSKMVISGTTSSQSPGLISKGHDTIGPCNSGRSGRGTSSSRTRSSLPGLPQPSNLFPFQLEQVSFWLHNFCICFPE